MRLLKLSLSALVAILLIALPLTAQDDLDPAAVPLVEVVEQSELFADWLARHPGYTPKAYGPDENGLWYIEFYSADDEWLGYANVDAASGEITGSFAPVPLQPADYQTQLDAIRLHVLADAEVLAWLNNQPDLWEVYPEWNRWEQRWDIGFYRGIEGVMVYAVVDENGDVYIADVLDPHQLDEAAALAEARDRAITLAYSAGGVDKALAGSDDWTTYAEPQGETQWGVTFVSGDRALFFALVDVEAGEVLSAE
jgi:hypothetical protein